MKRLKVFLLVGLVMVASFVSLLVYQVNLFLSKPISSHSELVVINIPEGSSAYKIAKLLQNESMLSSPKWFVWYLRYQGKQRLLKAGEMKINPTWTVDTLIDKLIKGQVVQYPVTLVAGLTFQQILAVIQSLPNIKKTLDIKDINSLQTLLKIEHPLNLKYPYAGLEGWLLPETYYYQSGASDKDIILRAYTTLQITLNQAWLNRDKGLLLKTPYEALILASIVEKESGVAVERPKIAGVFYGRMKKGMRLQTDPTVIYGMGQSYDGNIRKRDLMKATIYNTYSIKGLPPTPIALPSKEAILAVMHPEKTNALYFVAKKGGGHTFSKALLEHNRAVQRHIRGQ